MFWPTSRFFWSLHGHCSALASVCAASHSHGGVYIHTIAHAIHYIMRRWKNVLAFSFQWQTHGHRHVDLVQSQPIKIIIDFLTPFSRSTILRCALRSANTNDPSTFSSYTLLADTLYGCEHVWHTFTFHAHRTPKHHLCFYLVCVCVCALHFVHRQIESIPNDEHFHCYASLSDFACCRSVVYCRMGVCVHERKRKRVCVYHIRR